MGFHVIDSNVIIDFLNKRLPKEGMIFFDTLVKKNEAILSVITLIEVRGFNKLREGELQEILRLSKGCITEPLSERISELAIQIRQNSKRNIKTPDAIIAATAVFYEIPIITNNLKDFSDLVPEVQIINLHTP